MTLELDSFDDLAHGQQFVDLMVDNDVERLAARQRAASLDVLIVLPPASSFATPKFYALGGPLRLITVGLKSNAVLQRASQSLLKEKVRQVEQTGQPQRLFASFVYQAASWPEKRFVVAKAEATDARFIVTYRPRRPLMADELSRLEKLGPRN